MAEAFLGEIRLVGFNFPPNGWAFFNGQLLAISQNTRHCFSLLGTTYGDGIQTFALPDLRCASPLIKVKALVFRPTSSARFTESNPSLCRLPRSRRIPTP